MTRFVVYCLYIQIQILFDLVGQVLSFGWPIMEHDFFVFLPLSQCLILLCVEQAVICKCVIRSLADLCVGYIVDTFKSNNYILKA